MDTIATGLREQQSTSIDGDPEAVVVCGTTQCEYSSSGLGELIGPKLIDLAIKSQCGGESVDLDRSSTQRYVEILITGVAGAGELQGTCRAGST